MDCDDQRNAVVLFCQNSAEMAVPSVAMHDIGIDGRGIEIGAATHRAENRLQRFRTSKFARIERETGDLEPSLFEALIAETTNIDIDRLR